MKSKLFTLLALLSLIAFAFPAVAESDVATSVNEIIAYNERECGAETVTEWVSSGIASNAGNGAEWYAVALARYDENIDFTPYLNSLDAFLRENTVSGAVARQRIALAMLACGDGENPYIASVAADSIGEQGIMSRIFGLHLLNNGVKSDEYSVDDVVNDILSRRNSDGGFSLTGTNSDVDVTAMAIQALALHYSDASVKAAVDGALEFLSEKQRDDGGFVSYGVENAESASQVAIALCSLGIEPESDGRFIKNGKSVLDSIASFRLADGSYSHVLGGETNKTATVQSFCALVAVYRLRDGKNAFYDFDEKTVVSESSDTASDESSPESSSESSSDNTAKPDNGYKLIIYISVLAAAGVFCLIMRLRGKKNYKDYLIVLVVAAVICAAVAIIDVQTAEGYYGNILEGKGTAGSVTLSIRCDAVAGKSDSSYIPRDGVILQTRQIGIDGGETVYDVLIKAAKSFSIQVENDGVSPSSAYISGINYIYEFDFGDLSGWVYRVNGVSPSVGCGGYTLSDGDVVEWIYSTNLGQTEGFNNIESVR